MKISAQVEGLGNVVYQESFWTGKKTIKVNDVTCERSKADKKEYSFDTPEGKEVFTVEGGMLKGVSVWHKGKTTVVLPRPAWYEVLIAIIPFIFVMGWGNVEALVMIIPMVGGAIGGAISALGGCIALIVMRQMKDIKEKLIVGLSIAVGTIVVCAVLGFIIIAALAATLA